MTAAVSPAAAPVVGGNPWPCERCGSPITVGAAAGRVPAGSLVALLGLLALVGLTLGHLHAGALGRAVLSAAALLGTAVLGLRLRAAEAWRCVSCNHRGRPRLYNSGVVRAAVVIPAYDNAATVADVVRRAVRAAPELGVIVVDDGSTDGTGERALEAAAGFGDRVTVVRHERNRGKGAALVTGLAEALARGHSHAVTLDADGQHFPEDVPAVLAAAAAKPGAVIVGERDLSGDTVQTVSRFGRRFSNFWIRVQTGRGLGDSQSGFRVYPVAPVLSLGAHGRRYDFEVEVLILAARAGLELASVPIRVHYPAAAERVSHFHKLWDNVRISWVNVRLLVAAVLWPLGWPFRLARTDPPLARSRVWSGRSRGGALGHLFFLAVLKLFGRRVAAPFLYPVALYFMFGARSAVRASREFLDVVLGPAPGAWTRFWRSYRHVLTFAQCILDRAASQVTGARGFRWESEGEESVSSGRGTLLVSAHLGNYELGGALLHLSGRPVNVVMLDAEAEAIRAVHDRLGKSANAPRIIAINRGRFPALGVLSALRSGELVALHADRIVDERWTWCEFLGRPAPFPTGMFLMAAAARVPVVLSFGFREGSGRYRFVAEPPHEVVLPREGRDEALAEHARWYASRLEHYARLYPYQWFNFFDFWAAPPIPRQPAARESASAGA